MFGKSAFLQGSLFFLAGNLVNVLNYVFQILAGRLLSVEDYGVLNTLLALFFLVSVVSMALQTLTTRQYVDYRNEENSFLAHILRTALIWGGLAFVLFLIFIPWLKNVFHIYNSFLFVALGLCFVFTFALSAFRGVLQGRQNFIGLSANMIFESLVKILGFLWLFFLGVIVFSGILSVFISIFMAFIVIFLSLKIPLFSKSKPTKTPAKLINKKSFNTEFLHLLASLFFVTAFYNVDLLLVRHFLPLETGIYAVVSKFGQLVFFGNHLMAMTFFSYILNDSSAKKIRPLAFKVIFLGTLFSLFCAFFYYVSAPYLVLYLFGEAYMPAADYLWLSALSMGVLGIANFLMHVCFAQKNYGFLFGSAAVFLLCFGTTMLWHTSILLILKIFLFHHVLLVLVLLFALASPRWSFAVCSKQQQCD